MIFEDLKPNMRRRSSVDCSSSSSSSLNFSPRRVVTPETVQATTTKSDMAQTTKVEAADSRITETPSIEFPVTAVHATESSENSPFFEPMATGDDDDKRASCRRRSHDGAESLSTNRDNGRGGRRQQPRSKSFDSQMLTIKKYIVAGDSGIRRLNPEWEQAEMAKLKESINSDPTDVAGMRASFALCPFVNRSTALPIVSYPTQENLFDSEYDTDDSDHLSDEEHDERVARAVAVIKPTEEYEEAIQDYQSQWQLQALQEYENLAALQEYEDITKSTSFSVTVNHNNALDKQMQKELEQILERYEIPAGMLSKLLALADFGIAEIIVDDSASMNHSSDVEADFYGRYDHMDHEKKPRKGPKKFLTRWEEAKERILQMMELIAYIPTAPIYYVRFLNRDTVLELNRNKKEPPQAFLVRIRSILDEEFAKIPYENDGCPALKRIRESFQRHHKRTSGGVLRYFMSHGVPDGREEDCQKIVSALMYRTQPERTPFTFMSCTDHDADTVWMKECEEVAPYCSEFDDYIDESDEILRDQGKAFPYSYGLHLVGQLVAAFCPDDLDAMDESVPFPQPALADLLGYQLSNAEYKYYFDSFLEAQRKQWPSKEEFQKEFIKKLPKLYEDFQRVKLASELVDVRNFRRRLKADAPKIAIPPKEETPTSEQAPPQSPLSPRKWTKLFRENSLQKLFHYGKGKKDEPVSPNKKKNKLLRRVST